MSPDVPGDLPPFQPLGSPSEPARPRVVSAWRPTAIASSATTTAKSPMRTVGDSTTESQPRAYSLAPGSKGPKASEAQEEERKDAPAAIRHHQAANDDERDPYERKQPLKGRFENRAIG